MKTVDCIIVGQGVAGTLLSFELMQAGLTVQVIDALQRNSASRVASGVINPVTGRRVVETWKIDELLPLAKNAYERISDWLSIERVARQVDVLAIHNSEQMKAAYEKRCREGSAYIRSVENDRRLEDDFKMAYGSHAVHPALLIDLQTLLSRYRDRLLQAGDLINAVFDWSALRVPEHAEEGVFYECGDLQMQAKWVISTEGTGAMQNPYFKDLAFRYNKGEALIIAVKGLSRKYIYKLRYSIVPWGDQDLFWVGSTYAWEFEDDLPTASFKEAVLAFLDEVLRVPYEVAEHIASVRPASVDRRPFAGRHQRYPQIGVLNGLGTKGCSLAPYLAAGWKMHLLNGTEFDPEVALRIP